MKRMSANEIRTSWIKFFESKKHLFVEPVSLIPVNDPSLLWINSGVATLKKYFSGIENPPSPRLVNCQKAIRTNDIENVGKTARHQTLFEMLGNFSIGDYFKKQAIEFAYELLIKIWEVDINKLWFTVYIDDEITYDHWIKLGINHNRILKCGKERNFWDIGSGPCGACTEIYYDRGKKYDPLNLNEKLIIEDIENDRYIEIWNLVFSEFNHIDNEYVELSRKNIDTGAGLERIASISQDVPTNFDTDLFLPIINMIEQHSSLKYDMNNFFIKEEKQSKINFNYRVIADHLRASVFAIADGCIPSNKDRGYILRRLIRRFMVSANQLDIHNEKYIYDGVDKIIEIMQSFYPYLVSNKEIIIKTILEEYYIFAKTLKNGLNIFNETIKKDKIDSKIIFDLVSTYGFPIEIINELLDEKNIKYDKDEYNKLFSDHRAISNARTNIVGFNNQNANLIDVQLDSKFDYNIYKAKAKVLYLLDDKFNIVKTLNNQPGYAIFDITPFYARSGGQECDTGYVNNTQFIDEVIKTNNMLHLHHSNHFNLKLNEIVNLKINLINRKQLCRQHTSEHLLHASLKNVIDKNIKQEGAFKSIDKITFDFKYHKKLDSYQLNNIEKFINNIINEKIPIQTLFVTLEEAKQMNAAAYFEDVYKKIDTKLRLIKIGDKSIELCGGTHVKNTKNIEKFVILSYVSKGSGSWRIEATSSKKLIKNIINEKKDICKNYYFKYENIINKYSDLLYEYQVLFKSMLNEPIYMFNDNFNQFKGNVTKKIKQSQTDNNKKILDKLSNELKTINDDKIAIFINGDYDAKIFKEFIDNAINNYKHKQIALCNINSKNTQLIIGTNHNNNVNLNDIINKIKENNINIKGGGKNNYVQSGFSNKEDINKVKQILISYGYSICELLV